jgi:phasin family protein
MGYWRVARSIVFRETIMTDSNNAHKPADLAGGFGIASKSVQTFASEVARLSKETVDETTQLVEKLRAAKTLDEVVSIQTAYVQQSFSKYADYTRRIGELFTSLPLEIAKQSQSALQKTTEAVTKATDRASQQVQQGAEQVSQQVQHTTEQFSQHIEHAPEQFNQSFHQNNFDNQSYNNNDHNYNNNNQNY